MSRLDAGRLAIVLPPRWTRQDGIRTIMGMYGPKDRTFDGNGPPTTTILTLELPYELSFRLRQAMRRDGRRSLSKVALEALEAWVEDDERHAQGEAAGDDA